MLVCAYLAIISGETVPLDHQHFKIKMEKYEMLCKRMTIFSQISGVNERAALQHEPDPQLWYSPF